MLACKLRCLGGLPTKGDCLVCRLRKPAQPQSACLQACIILAKDRLTDASLFFAVCVLETCFSCLGMLIDFVSPAHISIIDCVLSLSRASISIRLCLANTFSVCKAAAMLVSHVQTALCICSCLAAHHAKNDTPRLGFILPCECVCVACAGASSQVLMWQSRRCKH